MSDFATTPLTFSAAQDFLAQKVDLPTDLSSLDISLKLPARIRAQSFFSAKVASANVLQALRTEVSAIAHGDYNYAEGRARLKTFLQRQGYGVPPVGSKEERDVRDLASTRRLDLVLRQNVDMASAVGQREVAEDPAVMELLPCYEYSTGPNPRAEHAAFDGLVLPKTDPFWATHYPPWDFNCNCMVLDTEAAANGKSSGFKASSPMNGHLDYNGMRQQTDNASGFEFDSTPAAAFGKPDFSTITDDDLRSKVEAAFKSKFSGVTAAAVQLVPTKPHVAPPPPPPLPAWQMPPAFKHFDGATPPEIAALAPAPTFVQTKSPTDAFYRPSAGEVHLNKNLTTWAGTPATYHHEVGHHLHHKLGIVSQLGMDPKFRDAINADVGTLASLKFGAFKFSDLKDKQKRWSISQEAAKTAGVKPAYDSGDNLAQQRVLFVFDTIGGMTIGHYGFGHSKTYYQRPFNGAKEVFANCTTAAILGWGEFKVYFPNVMQYIETRLGLTP